MRHKVCLVFCMLFIFSSVSFSAEKRRLPTDVQFWLTTADRSALFALQNVPLHFSDSVVESNAAFPVVEVNDMEKYQPIDGFGVALTGGSAQLLMHMDAAQRNSLLQELFGAEGKGIAVSYLRLTIGASDMNDHVFSYDDLPPGQTDVDMAKFNLGPDGADVIPVMKEILAINPRIKILGSPWSAPAWMKANDDVKGGHLKPEFYGAFANYFVKYISGMKAEGITIDAITVGNEPLNPKNTPSMVMFAPEQEAFVAKYLGPALQKAGINTKILLYDHNPGRYFLSLIHPRRPRRQQVCRRHRLPLIRRRQLGSD